MSRGFTLAGLLRLRRVEEDRRAVELNSARESEAIGIARTHRVRAALSESGADAESYASLVSIAATRASTAEMLVELGEIDAAAAGEVASAVTAHANAHRRTLGLEKLEARFEKQRAAEELKAEQRLLDDLATRAWQLENQEPKP